MQREIKFRAWDKKQKAFINGFNMIGFSTGQGAPKRKLQRFSDYWDMEDVVLMQYAGLHDKNDKEIYEGDIIDKSYISPLNGEMVIQRYIIEWHNGIFKAVFIKDKPYYDRYLWMEFKEVEVIGNIYENPELLEVSQ